MSLSVALLQLQLLHIRGNKGHAVAKMERAAVKKAANRPKQATTATGGSAKQHCMYYQPKKGRYCGFQRTPGALYCGNHLHMFVSGGEERVPCPANPAHNVPKNELRAHLAKCPKAIATAAARAQPYFLENVNSGHPSISLPDLLLQQHQPGSSSLSAYLASLLDPSDPAAAQAAAVAAEAAAPFQRGVAARRQAAAVALGPQGFAALMQRVEGAHAALTAQFPLTRRLLGGTAAIGRAGQPAAAADEPAAAADEPAAAADEPAAAVGAAAAAAGAAAAVVSVGLREFSLGLDPMMPFDAEHALQHASIVGNMAAAGLLAAPRQTLFVELGAGKGFLTAWLHQVCGAAELLMLDLQGNFAKKADRRLRHTCLTRVALDLKDVGLLPLMRLHLAGDARVQQWQAAQRQFRADGLQRKRQKQQLKQEQEETGRQEQQQGEAEVEETQQATIGQTEDAAAGQQQQEQQQEQQQQQQQQPNGCEQQQQAGRRERKRQPRQPKPRSEADTVVSGGLCCCADRCQQPYPAPLPAIYYRQPGQQQQQQQQVHPLLLQTQPGEDDHYQQQQQQATIPWVVHGKHLCGAATDFALRACYNAIKQQELLLRQQQRTPHPGSTANASSSSSSTGPQQQADQQQQLFDLQGLAIATCCHQKAGWTSFVAKQQLAAAGISREDFEVVAWMTGWALCGHEMPPGALEGAGGAGDEGSATANGAQETAAAPGAAAGDGFHPADVMSRSQRMALGMRCKQLLDAARCAWIQQELLPAVQQQQLGAAGGARDSRSRLGVVRVAYTDLSVTGENTLLLLGKSCCDD